MNIRELKKVIAACKDDTSVWQLDSLQMLWLGRSGLWLRIPELKAIFDARPRGCSLNDAVMVLMKRYGGDYPHAAAARLGIVPSDMEAPRVVLSRDGKEAGLVKGFGRPCRLEGCLGWRWAVRWPDGKLTQPCSKGMKTVSGAIWQLEALTAPRPRQRRQGRPKRDNGPVGGPGTSRRRER